MMMRWLGLVIGICLIGLGVVACTPDEGVVVTEDGISTSEDVVNGDGENENGTSEDVPEGVVIVTRTFGEDDEPDTGLAIPAPGEFVASETEDPDANVMFDRIHLIRSGEVDGEVVTDVVEIFPNGRYTRNGVGGVTTMDEIARIQERIIEANFFGIQGAMLGPTADTPDYRYRLTIERGGLTGMIQSQDGFMPVVYRNLLGEILLVGMR